MEFSEVLSSLGEAVTVQAPLDVTWRPMGSVTRPVDDVVGRALTLTTPRPAPPGASWPSELVVLETIGSGGMGSVLLARQAALDRSVAVKVPHGAADGPEARALLEEARVAGALEHPAIVSFHALAYDEKGTPGLVMKHVEGASWAELLRAPDEAWRALFGPDVDRLEANLRIAVQLCQALGYAHARRVLHRDVKPGNVLIGEFGAVALIDWGVALKLDTASAPSGRAQLVGTPAYFAPEMVRGLESALDERTDVYLLGASLAEALSGVVPHPGTTIEAVLEHAWRCPAPSLPQTVPAQLVEVLCKAMARDPAQRYPTMVAFRLALEAVLRRRQVLQLVAAANQHLHQLEAEVEVAHPSRERVSALLAACRFGFLQVLHGAPEDAEARAGLERALLVAIRFELAQQNVGGVRALLAELPRVPAELEAAAEALEEAQERSQVKRTHLAKLAAQENPASARRERARLFVALLSAVVVVTFLSTEAPVWQTWLGADHLLGRLLPTALVLGVVVALERRQLLSTRINRRLTVFQAACLVGLGFNRVVLTRLGLDVPSVLTADLVLLTMAAVTLALMMHWGFFVSASFLAVGAVACLALPSKAELLFGLFASLAYGSVIFTWARWRSDFEVPAPA
ncbi:MAG: serine/threonine protein kinase [Myxococcaceae bacterium]|jgi:hypothetical protein|nr:serine/threonine protein kinase [Myxococcaceae bacterium]